MSQKLKEALEVIVRLAEVESTVKGLALEIERTKRRVPVLEAILIARLDAAVNFVKIALEE